MPEPKRVTITIDDRTVTVPEGTLITEAAKLLGISIPIFCSHHRLQPLGACRICLIEKDKVPKPVIACAETAAEGAVYRTQSEMALKARKGIMEYLLVNHPLDCPICDEGGECDLQDTSYDHGISETRFDEMKRAFDQVDLGPIVVLDRNRCIVCARCVRYCKDIMGDSALTIEERGFRSQITTHDGGALDCQQCGNCVEVCPVGALTSRPYRFKARPWDLKQTETVCTFCSNGCTFHAGRLANKVLRNRAKKSHGVNRDFLCARGRFGYEFPASPDRVLFPRVRQGGNLVRAEWSEALALSAAALRKAKAGNRAVAALGSARQTNEDLYLLQKLVREVLGSAHLDHRLEARQALSGETLRQLAGFNAPPVEDILTAGAVLVFGEDLNEEQPLYGTSVLREVHYRSMPTVVAHSRRVRLMREATHGLLYRGGSELAAARGLLKAAAGCAGANAAAAAAVKTQADGWTWDAIAAQSGLAQADFEGAAAKFLSAAGRVVFFGTQVLRHPDAEALVTAMIDLALVADASLAPLWDRANSQGAIDMGCVPDLGPGYAVTHKPGWSASEILRRCAAGEVGVLILSGADPLAHFPDRKLAEAALRKADFVLALDLFENESAALAHALVPVAAFTEVEGTFTNSERRIQALREASAAPDDVLPAWRVFAKLADAMGAGWKYPDVRAVQEEIREKAPMYAALSRRVGPAAPIWTLAGASRPAVRPVADGRPAPAPPPGTLRVETGNVIFHHGTLTQHNPVQVQLLPGPTLYLDESDAKRLKVADGDLVLLEGASARVEARVRVGGPAGSAAPGVAFYPDHFVGAEANRLIGPDAAYADLKLSPLSTAVHS